MHAGLIILDSHAYERICGPENLAEISGRVRPLATSITDLAEAPPRNKRGLVIKPFDHWQQSERPRSAVTAQHHPALA